MSEWKQKRFWKTVSVEPEADGFVVALDGRRVKTPAKAALILPTRAMADMIAQEWDAQIEEIDPTSMPATRSANAAIDKVAVQHAEVANMLADYGDSDLLCYRAESPRELADRQAQLWDPALDWAADALGVRLQPRAGIMHQAQDAEGQAVLATQVHEFDPFQLAAFHDLVTLPGSLILGFAAAKGWKTPDEIWNLAQLDELWQEEQWGADDEAVEARLVKLTAFRHAKVFFDLATRPSE
jgi:chaperone required for assembly of F1-ATPase